MEASFVRFVPINLNVHADICVQFRRDSYVCSFGSAERFDQENGADGAKYLEWLCDRLSELPGSCVHLWRNDKIIGQMEMRLRGNPPIGYINLFYLIPEVRGSRIGQQMQDYAKQFLTNKGATKVQLSVSPTNVRAIKYYLKHGWADLGPRPAHPEVHLMEIDYSGLG